MKKSTTAGDVKNIPAINNMETTKFSKLTKAQQRVAVAKDVIARLKSKQYKAESGTWVDIYNLDYSQGECSLQDKLVKDKQKCDCCALGGILLSLVALKNKVTIDDYTHDYLSFDNIDSKFLPDKTGILKLFSRNQLKLIETAFEIGSGYFENYYVEQTIGLSLATAFGEKYKSEKNRLIAIMQNIIENDGTFKP